MSNINPSVTTLPASPVDRAGLHDLRRASQPQAQPATPAQHIPGRQHGALLGPLGELHSATSPAMFAASKGKGEMENMQAIQAGLAAITDPELPDHELAQLAAELARLFKCEAEFRQEMQRPDKNNLALIDLWRPIAQPFTPVPAPALFHAPAPYGQTLPHMNGNAASPGMPGGMPFAPAMPLPLPLPMPAAGMSAAVGDSSAVDLQTRVMRLTVPELLKELVRLATRSSHELRSTSQDLRGKIRQLLTQQFPKMQPFQAVRPAHDGFSAAPPALARTRTGEAGKAASQDFRAPDDIDIDDDMDADSLDDIDGDINSDFDSNAR